MMAKEVFLVDPAVERLLKAERIAALTEAAETCRCPGCAEDIRARIHELERE